MSSCPLYKNENEQFASPQSAAFKREQMDIFASHERAGSVKGL